MKQFIIKVLFAMCLTGSATHLLAQTKFETEQQFHDLFITAGYSTAFGAALGAACLAWTDSPADRLYYIAMGASFGFIGGSILGTYIVFSPMFVSNELSLGQSEMLALSGEKSRSLALRPIFNVSSRNVTGIQAELSLLNF